jgi:hypothetical protein
MLRWLFRILSGGEDEDSFEDNSCIYTSFISKNDYKYLPVLEVPKWVDKKIDKLEKQYSTVPMDKKFYFKGKTYRYAVSYQAHPSGTMTWFYWKRKRGEK